MTPRQRHDRNGSIAFVLADCAAGTFARWLRHDGATTGQAVTLWWCS